MLAITMTDNFLATVDRFSGKLGLFSAAIDKVMERFAPIKQAVGCGSGVLCYSYCEWTETCCCGLPNGKNQRFEVRASSAANCASGMTFECSSGCSSACGNCGGC